ncbi:TlpA family protein disulfide reductase [Myroides odoratus]|uniref:Redoxin family protein n=1 Tax=Myroides odoratus TaxID=256 RepID=A0A9Q7EAP4_MYROD|nr:redoxin family protein [Myroides odoratus]EHQ42895.1 protein of unknown function DUF820 [Myroides odoratus DSM 2801]EKB07473.1 hypothetical protein HMPREF9716_01923 [Myroides odoratus CIP 103059]QQU00244.1 redoxin family protein [Myroides odoratus]WQD57531.1 redoxin family protein [Myroides odoratus]STZ30160.1 thiol-disulfide oxidoreductase [Myroides odoratus]
MIKKLVLGSAILLVTNAFAQDELHFKGNIKGIPNDAQVWLSVGKEQKEMEVKDGKFDVRLPLEGPESVFLYLKQDNEFKHAVFYLGNEEVWIEGSVEDFPSNLQAQNSKHDALRYQEYLLTKDLQAQMDELEDEAYELIEGGADKDSLYEVYMGIPSGKVTKVRQQLKVKEFDFIREHINTDYGRFLLKFNTTDFTTAQFKTLVEEVDPVYKSTKEIQFIQALVDYPTLQQGDQFYDFKALDNNQQQVNFKSFFDGRYVLLDFSTWFCGYCHRAAPLTAEMAEQLEDKLNYVTYYVDNDEDSLALYFGLKENKGTLLWNKEGEFNSTLAKYRQTGTPHYVLFDPKGKVVEVFEGIKDDFPEQIKKYIQG